MIERINPHPSKTEGWGNHAWIVQGVARKRIGRRNGGHVRVCFRAHRMEQHEPAQRSSLPEST